MLLRLLSKHNQSNQSIKNVSVMNKLILLSSLFLTVWNATPQNNQPEEDLSCMLVECHQPELVPVDEIYFIEEEETIDLGFDTSAYLPENFDPYGSKYQGEDWIYLDDLEIDLGFDTKAYLPKDFDPYASPVALK